MKKILLIFILPLFLLKIWAYNYIVIGTGDITGVYYPTGGAVCRLFNQYYKNKSFTKCMVESTPGSIYNIKALQNGDLDFAIAQSDDVYNAYYGKDFFKKHSFKNLRVIMSIYPELLTFVIRKDSGIKNFFDQKGHIINIGNPGSGNEIAVKTLFKASKKISLNDIKIMQLKANECPKALKNRKIDGYYYMVGHPAQNIKNAANLVAIDLISLANVPAARKLVKKNPYYTWGVIPANMYKGVTHSTKTYGVKAILVTTDKMDEKIVYFITQSILKHFKQFKKMYPAYKNLTKKDLLKGFDLRMIHKGAKKAFEEEGLLK